jgi:hypothetical protein
MSERVRLPDRRLSETAKLEHAGLMYTITISRDRDGVVRETFVQNHKNSSHVDIAARDGGVLLSLLLQYNCPLEVIARALLRNSDGSPSGIMGAAVDLILAGDASP